MVAILKREFRSFFTNVTGWIFIAAFLFLYNLYFYVFNLSYGYAYLSYALSNVTFVFLIIIPILSMRILSEDKKLKTDQMIYTAPVSVFQAVMGKFLAMVAVLSIVMGIVCICPLILSLFGTVPFAESYTAILGTWLFAVLCLSIGLFVSSLTENLVIAAIGTFALLLLGYMMPSIASLISQDGNALTKVLNCLATASWSEQFCNGILELRGILYYVSGTALFVFLTCQVIQRSRWQEAVKKIRRGVYSTGLIVVVIAAVVAVNVGASRIPSKYTDIDVSYNDVHSITSDTKKMLKDLSQDVTLYVLVSESQKDSTLDQTLQLYQDESSHIKVEYIDPDTSPQFYATYADSQPTNNSVIVVCGERSKVIDYNKIYESSFDYSTYSNTTTGYDGEGQLTSAISYVTSEDQPDVYVLTGHGETELGSTFTDALEKKNLNVETVNLLQKDSISVDEVAGVIINGPTSDFSAEDVQKVKDYLVAGGKVIITTSYAGENLTNFNSLLAEYDVQAENGVVVEGSSQNYTQYPIYLLPEVETSDLTSSLNSYVILPNAQAITNLNTKEDTLDWEPLFDTSDSAYRKSDVKNIKSLEKEDGDKEGSYCLGAAVTNSETGGKMIVVGTSYVFNDNADAMVSGTNLQFFTNAISVFQSEDSSVSIPVKSYTLSLLTVNQLFTILGGMVLVIIVPIIVIVVGILIWVRRRKK